MMENQKKKEKLERIQFVFVIICFVWVFLSGWLGETVFAYEVKTEKTVKEPYEYVVDEVWDYTCYVTTYGECYHDKGCQYLYSSSHAMDLEDAIYDGYRACSKCDPPRKLPVSITETRYRTITKTTTETKEPIVLVWAIGTGVIVLACYVSTYKLRKELDK